MKDLKSRITLVRFNPRDYQRLFDLSLKESRRRNKRVTISKLIREACGKSYKLREC
jgi:hypothetical protein